MDRGRDVRPANTRLSSASTTIGPGDLYGHLTWVPFMGQAEFRSGPFGVITDYIHAPLKSGVTTGEILFGGGTANFTIDTGSAVFLYRALALPNQNADVGLGFRAWGLDGADRVEPAAAAGVSDRPWPMAFPGPIRCLPRAITTISATGLPPRLTAISAASGSGAHFDWQLLGTIDYALRPGSTCTPASAA